MMSEGEIIALVLFFAVMMGVAPWFASTMPQLEWWQYFVIHVPWLIVGTRAIRDLDDYLQS